MSYHRFRLADTRLSTFTDDQKTKIRQFYEFVNDVPDGYCCLCMIVLYPEDQKWRDFSGTEIAGNFPCQEWNLEPLTNDEDKKMVCKTHFNTSSTFIRMTYPGDLVPETQGLNYRELSVLSPIKLMSQITRKSTLRHGRIGHYEVKGSMYTKPNYEFADLAYGQQISFFFQRGVPGNINKNKVEAAYEALRRINPVLARYKLPKLTYSLINYHVRESKKYVRVQEGWENNSLFSNDDTHPQATDVNFYDLVIGRDTKDQFVKYSYPSLMALVFPYLFTTCTGHYSMVPTNVPEYRQRTGIYGIPENQGGVSDSLFNGENIASFAKKRLMLKDRRFARDPSFLFFMLDLVEKKSISAANHLVVSTKGRGNLKAGDIVNPLTKKLNKNIVSIVPPQVRSSYAFKRRNFLDLQCIFENLGAPQLFLTFTCDDKSKDFKNLSEKMGMQYPWDDPVLFTLHFKRKWLAFFKKHIKDEFGDYIGGIRDFSWVMEVQDRGSPHIHMVLWTNKSVQELIDMNLVHTWYPEGGRDADPALYELVENRQVHTCNVNYCKRGDPSKKCRFGYPKPYCTETALEADSRCVCRRDVSDANINNYNPYLLAVFRTSMDIQYNDGPQAVRYLAKYLAKDDYQAKIILSNIQSGDQGFYKRSSYVSEREHNDTRIVGAAEASYDLLGWHKHQNSRKVVFIDTSLLGQDTKAVRKDIHDQPTNSEDVYAKSPVYYYEGRNGAYRLTMPEFYCYYNRDYSQTPRTAATVSQGLLQRPYYPHPLPEFVCSHNAVFKLVLKEEHFWRTFNQNEINGESFYYQQIVTKHVLSRTTYENAKGNVRSWRDFYEHLINLPVGGITPHRRVNVNSVDDVSEAERGLDTSRAELMVMLNNANASQKSVYTQVIRDFRTNSVAFVSGAAGTGKSYVLRMFERHYRLKGYKVFKMAPTGVAAYNISGMTVHRFFGLTNVSSVPNFTNLDQLFKLYPKMVLLIDEYSMMSAKLLELISDALVKTTGRSTPMGGIKTIFFGDIAQLLPIQRSEGSIWESPIFSTANRYSLIDPVRQTDPEFVRILNQVRNYDFDRGVIEFINERTVHKSQLPPSCLRLYPTRERVRQANERDYREFPGIGKEYSAYDTYGTNCNKRTAKSALRETRLLESLQLKKDMPVMLIHNINVASGWVNGTIALVESLEDENICLRRRLPNGNDSMYYIQRISRDVPRTSYVRTQYPILPAFATTIHKAQSATIDCVGIYLDSMPAHGQLYVAMSRVRKKEDLYFFGVDQPISIQRRFGVDADALELIRRSSNRLS